MVLQSSGLISCSNISLEFMGVSNIQINLSDYYTNALSKYTTGVVGLPVIGNTMYLSSFYNKSCISGVSLFTTVGNTSWTIPNGVNMISAVCIGAGASGTIIGPSTSTGMRTVGGGGGGALAYVNKIRVIPGTIFTITVGAAGLNGTSGGDSYITNNIGQIIVNAGGGKAGQYMFGSTSNTALGGAGGTVLIGSGGNGGSGGTVTTVTAGYINYGGGGGAGGYSGNGGIGGNATGAGGMSAGTGGGGGGGWGGRTIYSPSSTPAVATLGGGTGAFGIGNNGLASTAANIAGSNGSINTGTTIAYGAGAGGKSTGSSQGGPGCVRIIYGTQSSFPSTNVGGL